MAPKVHVVVWIASRLLGANGGTFTKTELLDLARQKLSDARPGLSTHVSSYCVASSRANPGKFRYLTAIGRGRYRIYRHGDPVHPTKAKAPTHPEFQDIPEEYRYLLDQEPEAGESAASRARQPASPPVPTDEEELRHFVSTSTRLSDKDVEKLRQPEGEAERKMRSLEDIRADMKEAEDNDTLAALISELYEAMDDDHMDAFLEGMRTAQSTQPTEPTQPTTKARLSPRNMLPEKAAEKTETSFRTEEDVERFVFELLANTFGGSAGGMETAISLGTSQHHLIRQGATAYRVGDRMISHKNDILVEDPSGKPRASLEVVFRSAVTDHFKARTYDFAHMKKQHPGLKGAVVYVKSNAGISPQQARRICYEYDFFFSLREADALNSESWTPLIDTVREWLGPSGPTLRQPSTDEQ